MFRSRITRHVHFSDCDPAQIVFYPRYYVWFDQATESLFRAVGLLWEKMLSDETGGFAGVPLLGASADFKAASRMGDEVEIESWIDDWADKTFVVHHRLTNAGRLSVIGREQRIWVVRDRDRPNGIRAASIPPEIRALFDRG